MQTLPKNPFRQFKVGEMPPKNEIDKYYLNNYGEWKKKPDMTSHFKMQQCIINASQTFRPTPNPKESDRFQHVWTTCVKRPLDTYYFHSVIKSM